MLRYWGCALAKPKRKVDIGIATIVAAVIVALSGWGTFIGTKVTASVTNPAPATGATQGPESVTINQPSSGTIHWADNYSGGVVNLQPGQLVWTFNQTVTGNSISSSVYPNSGPCTVDYGCGSSGVMQCEAF